MPQTESSRTIQSIDLLILHIIQLLNLANEMATPFIRNLQSPSQSNSGQFGCDDTEHYDVRIKYCFGCRFLRIAANYHKQHFIRHWSMMCLKGSTDQTLSMCYTTCLHNAFLTSGTHGFYNITKPCHSTYSKFLPFFFGKIEFKMLFFLFTYCSKF